MTDSTATLPEDPEFCELFTTNLRLCTVRVSDAEELMPLITRYDVMRWTSHGPVSSIDQARRWLSDRALGKDVFNFAIELKDRKAQSPDAIRLIGLAGSFHPPEIGYMIHPGNGYATEAISAIIPRLFERMPSASEGGTGFDYLEAWADVQNLASHRVLEKVGFTYCETVQDPDNEVRGPTQTVIWRKARPGKHLEQLGLVASKSLDLEHDAPQPPVQ